MSMYNMMFGYSPACVYFLPMLGRKQDEYPRFRDCFLDDDEKHILIYTRVGGNNRNCGFGEEELYKDSNFVETYDESFDNTYGYYKFSVPEKWREDFERIKGGKFEEVSDDYLNTVKKFYPLLAEKGLIDALFRRTQEESE